ncbi:gamma-secretase-activating protein isoform X2 [Clupea harengus]|uniref:Gamma-secretase-activating protein isoform X2 n=1 Tax=Clupea harengus TaxID=7950 RepID=A0A6P8GRY3_CLUHA|nr:gamma-secretase-activating protein isoform X2 [Clupea harengus]
MIQLNATFDLQQDVISSILKKEETARATTDVSDPRILHVERDGGVLYCWRGATGTTRIGKYDPHSKHNKLLYTFDKQVCVSSCSLNKEETLLAVSLTQKHRQEELLRPVSKCLTLLIEIHPINNTKVLKAVDCRVRVQFLHPDSVQTSVLESHLLLITEDGYVDQFHIMLARHEGYRVVMLNPDRLAKDRVAEDFSWVQWDSQNQRLYFLTSRERNMECVQFHPQRNCETVFELPLELPCNPFSSMSFVHLGFDHYYEDGREEGISLVVFTDKTGSMCVCYSHPVYSRKEVRYTIAFVHKGCSKTFTVALDQEALCSSTNLQPLFFHTGHYVVVFLAGHFLHLLNTRQQDLLCYSFFLSGSDACLGEVGGSYVGGTHGGSSLLELQSGRMYTPTISSAHLMDFLHAERPEAQRLATLQCMLVYKGAEPEVERQVIDWICGDVLSFHSFDQIQEFILASLYRITHQHSLCLDMLLPYSSVFQKKELPVALTMIPGVKCTPALLPQPLFKGKFRNKQGFWTELQCVCERVKTLETLEPNPRFRTAHIQEEWSKVQAGVSSEKRKASHQRHLEENTKKVLSMVDTCRLDTSVVPLLFQEEDPQQKGLIGTMVDKLREHLNRHLPQLGKKRTDALVVNYVAKLLELVHHMLELLWHKYNLGPQVLCLKQQGSPEEWSVFHVMLRILEATKGLGLPLPPGYNSLLAVLGLKCVCRHSFLQFVDHSLLQLTEPFVSRLMKDLDNSDENEALKFSILKRLPEPMLERVCHLWDHPVSSACISRNYVSQTLQNVQIHQNQDKIMGFGLEDPEHSSLWPDFLPLSYLTKVLSDLEKKALNPFEEQENVDARFVEETALKQTLIELRLEDKT